MNDNNFITLSTVICPIFTTIIILLLLIKIMENLNNFENVTLKDGFAGDRRYLKGFLAKIELIFLLYPEQYVEDEKKVIYIISRLYGNAMNWAATLIENNDPCLHSYEAFVGKLKAFYGNNDSSYIANQMLRVLKQRNIGGVRGYILEFNKYADESTWNEEAKMDAFMAGLNEQVATRILEMFPGPQNLFAMQTIASRIDSRLHTNRNFFNLGSSSSGRKSPRTNTPRNNVKKQNNFRGPLPKEEKERRRRNNLCLYCGSASHSLKDCPVKRNKENSTSSTFMSIPTGPTPIPRRRTINDSEFVIGFSIYSDDEIPILIDSGSELNLIDERFCEDYGISFSDDGHLPKIVGIGGKQTIFGVTTSVNLKYKDHLCKTKFYVTNLPRYGCILGSNWLRLHNPNIDFLNKELTFNSEYCLSNCISLPISLDSSGNLLSPNLKNSSFPVLTSQYSSNPAPSDHNTHSALPIFINDEPSEFSTYSASTIPVVNKSSKKFSKYNTPFQSSKKDNSTTVKVATSIKEASNTDDDLVSLPKVLLPFKDVFSETAADKLPPHRPYDCEIKLKENSKLFYGPIYPLTDEESNALEEYINDNLRKGFIRKSKSPAGAPVLFVPKKNGKLRMCVDYRQLNLITIRDSYPLPLIQDMLEHLGKGKIFSKLDLRSAYNLVRIKNGDEYKTAFTCKFGHFEYLVMPFGLKNAPAVFQHFINDVLEEVLGNFAYAYIDDIIIFSPDYKTHINHVITVLKLLRSAGLYAKLEKCEFFVSFIDFLGHRISGEGIHMDPNKVSSILNWPTPTNVKEVQSFIGLANYYRRFIPNFAKIAHPLHKLLKKNTKFLWSPETQSSFDNLKSKFVSAPILIYPNREIPFQVETDSSNFAIGAILSQVSPQDNMVHPVAFFSRSLTATERNYPIYDKELLAIVSALETWRHLLKGSTKPFKIFSDHRNLLYQKKPEKMSQRLVRWALFLSEFNFVIVYRSGSSNGKPDALSRRADYAANYNSSSEIPFNVLRPENFCALVTSISSLNESFLSEYKTDEFYNKICDYLDNKKLPIPHPQIDKFSLSNSFLLFNSKIYVPSKCRPSVLKICHDSPSAGHFGTKKTISLISRDFWWPSLYNDVKDYIRSCETCCRSKSSRHKPYGLLNSLEIPDHPWSSIAMDFITDLPSADGFTCIFVVIDRLTKMCHLIPFKGIPSAVETAHSFIDYVFRLHGLPSSIISDRGTQFTSKFFQALCSSLDISLKLSTPFHHQTNGQTERVNSVIEQYLRCFSNYKGNNWNKFLSLAEFSYNNAVQESAKQSPFFLNYGFHPRHSPAIPDKANVPRAMEFSNNFNEIIKNLKANLELAIETQKKYADMHRSKPPEFKIGEKVWLDSSLVIHKGNKKFKPRKLGPYKIIEKISELSYKLELPQSMKIHPVVHVSSLEPFYEDHFDRKQEPPPPITVNDEEEYEVEEILDKRRHYRKIQYLVKWKGYPLSEASWEPEANLNCPELLKAFNLKNKK